MIHVFTIHVFWKKKQTYTQSPHQFALCYYSEATFNKPNNLLTYNSELYFMSDFSYNDRHTAKSTYVRGPTASQPGRYFGARLYFLTYLSRGV